MIIPKEKTISNMDEFAIMKFIANQFVSYDVHLAVTIKCPDGYVAVGRKKTDQETLLGFHNYWRDTEESVIDVEDLGLHIKIYDKNYLLFYKMSEDIENGRMDEDENIQA